MANQRAQKAFFAFNGSGPYECVFCGEEVLGPWADPGNVHGRESRSLLIHHRNHVRKDDRPENLEPAHYGCHTRHHMREGGGAKAGKASWQTPEQRAVHGRATAARNRRRGELGLDLGKPKSEETRQRMKKAANSPEGKAARARGGKSQKGKKLSEHTKSLISESRRGIKLSPEHAQALHDGSRRRWARYRLEKGGGAK